MSADLTRLVRRAWWRGYVIGLLAGVSGGALCAAAWVLR